MAIFDKNILNDVIFYDCTKYGDVKTSIIIEESWNYTNLDLFMQSDEDKPRSLVVLYTKISDHNLEIIDFISHRRNLGNGRQVLTNLKKCIDVIESVYKIDYIRGYLSFVDYNHWGKLIHLYSTIDPSYKFIADNKFTADYMLSNLNEFERENLNFRIYIH